MTWHDQRLIELHARRAELDTQWKADQAEPCEEVRRIKSAITNSQIALNNLHIEMLRSFASAHE